MDLGVVSGIGGVPYGFWGGCRGGNPINLKGKWDVCAQERHPTDLG